ncbi:MAG: methyltransferase domain-containing protein [Methylovirgula sp.]|uniref:methyltransferase domain-containing protein n=1 Tax=Methylovirgula sp. TaxID=1978224 RepID=UPI0030761101
MMALDFSRRNQLSEMMDAEDTDFATFRECLVDLTKVNRLTLAYRPTLSFFKRLAASGALQRHRTVNVVDVGSGSGDMLRRIDLWATTEGYKFDLVGIDLNPWSAKTAAQLTQENPRLRFITANIFDYRPAAPIDIVISSLFTHHLDNEAIVKFLRWMEANTRIGWFVNDLQRHPLAYHAFKHASHALRFHHFVQHDGPVSIARAFSAADWQHLLGAADISGARVKAYVPFRLCVSQIKPK